jgi:hypothetical protein
MMQITDGKETLQLPFTTHTVPAMLERCPGLQHESVQRFDYGIIESCKKPKYPVSIQESCKTPTERKTCSSQSQYILYLLYFQCFLVLFLESSLAVQRHDHGTIYNWKSIVKTSHGALQRDAKDR